MGTYHVESILAYDTTFIRLKIIDIHPQLEAQVFFPPPPRHESSSQGGRLR